jgi:8-oxo-dGTP pyrophosphatase MutT (NUDIX family)
MTDSSNLKLRPWKTTARSILLSCGDYLTIENHVVELPDGKVINDWTWIIAPDYVNVLAITADERILCFRQFKYAVVGFTLAPVGGYINTCEDPLSAAKRELFEETGYEAETWVHLGSFSNMANRGGGQGHAYLAREITKVSAPNSDDLEDQELLFLEVEAVEQALVQGEFKVASWAASVALALLYLKRYDNT